MCLYCYLHASSVTAGNLNENQTNQYNGKTVSNCIFIHENNSYNYITLLQIITLAAVSDNCMIVIFKISIIFFNFGKNKVIYQFICCCKTLVLFPMVVSAYFHCIPPKLEELSKTL